MRRCIEATIPSLIDPGLIDDAAREGSAGRAPIRHVLSVIVHQAPYALREGTWDERSEDLGDLVQRTLESYAPGFGGLVMARQVITPLDLERDLRPDRRPSRSRASLASTSGSPGGRCSAALAIGCRSRACTCAAPAPIPAAA